MCELKEQQKEVKRLQTNVDALVAELGLKEDEITLAVRCYRTKLIKEFKESHVENGCRQSWTMREIVAKIIETTHV